MALVTLDQVKTHLHIPLDTTDRDADVQDKAEQASSIILDYLKSRALAGWSDASLPVPGPVQAATLLLVANLDENRGDRDMKNDADCWLAIERLLMRFRDPALA